MKQVRLNRVEVWIADHALPIFGAVSLAIITGAIAIVLTFLNQSAVEHKVDVLRPQVTRVNKAICDKQSLDHSQRAQRCAERIRVGLINCRRSDPCRAALFAAITYSPPKREVSLADLGGTKGGGAQQPSHHGHQQPSPGPQPGPPTPPPAAPPAPGNSGEAPGQSGANPGQSGAEPPGQSGANNGQASGIGVEVCALERTCIGIDSKGLLP